MQIEHSSQFVKAQPSSSLLNAKFTLMGTSPTNHFRTDSYANEFPTTLSLLTLFT